MRTTANFKGHPIHSILVAFPIAFLTAAFVSDVVGKIIDSDQWWRAGAGLALAGIITALLAAIPGFIDYFYSIPPRSSAKRRATYHLSVNLTVVVLFAVAWTLRGWPQPEPTATVLVLEAVALGLLMIGGWLGGTLVVRNFIGPEHRYANAGRWTEANIQRIGEGPVVVAEADELAVDQMKLLHIDGQRIVLGRTEQGYVAFDDHCTHRGGSLADGILMCGKVQCLWHGSQFDVHTGQTSAGPATTPIRTYLVQEQDGQIRLLL
jgi:uncharacterized membrane protein/nitrite reductase/ring-hydroxylating ferredoxin subunit